MWHRTSILGVVLVSLLASSLQAEETTSAAPEWLRTMLARILVTELSEHDSKEDAWTSEDVEHKRKRIGLLVTKWSREISTWVWLEAPEQNLKVELTDLVMRGDQLGFALQARGRVKFEVEVKVSRMPRMHVRGEAHGTFRVEGTCLLRYPGLAEADVTRLDGQLDGITFGNDILDAFRGTIRNVLNRYLDRKRDDLSEKIERAINKAKIG